MSEICKVPFGFIEIFPNGDVFSCCPAYLKNGMNDHIGNIFKESFDEIINSEKAIRIRKNILNNDYSMCKLELCKLLSVKTRTPDRKWGYLLFCAKRRIIDSPLLQPWNKGLSCRVRFHHPNLLFVSFSRRVQRPLRCTRTPTAVKGNAFARFRTTACRLRSHRTLSASGRFSTSDSPPSIPLNLYSKGAAPREGLLLSSGSGYSIAARFLFVNDLINKN